MATLRTGEIETYYERHGEGPPVVLVHASIVDHGAWSLQAEALSDAYTVVTYDLRGHGRTGASDEPVYTVDRFAEDLAALVDRLGLDSPVLVGHSMGGLISQAYAAQHPDRIAGLVLVDSFTPPIRTWGEWFLRRIVMNALILPARIFGYERIERLNVWMTEKLFRGSSGDYGKIQHLRQSGPPMSTDEFAKVIRAMTHAHEHPIDLGAITAPTLVLTGEDDLPFIHRHAEALATELDDVQVQTIEDAGHAAPLDQPEAFNAALRGFLDRLHPWAGATEAAAETGNGSS